MISNSKLALWESICEKATPGPWKNTQGQQEDDKHLGRVKSGAGTVIAVTRDINAISGGNGEFVVLAREAMPELIAEVRRLRHQLSEME